MPEGDRSLAGGGGGAPWGPAPQDPHTLQHHRSHSLGGGRSVEQPRPFVPSGESNAETSSWGRGVGGGPAHPGDL